MADPELRHYQIQSPMAPTSMPYDDHINRIASAMQGMIAASLKQLIIVETQETEESTGYAAISKYHIDEEDTGGPEYTRARMERSSKKWDGENGIKRAKLLVAQITERISADHPDIPRSTIDSYVVESLFKGAVWRPGEPVEGEDEKDELFNRLMYGTFTPPDELPFLGGANKWQNTAITVMDTKYGEVQRDPTMPLMEDKLKMALLSAVQNKSFGPDSMAIATMILGTDILELALGYPVIDVDPDTVMRLSGQVTLVLEQFKDGMADLTNAFAAGAGGANLGKIVWQAVKNSAEKYFASLAVLEDVSKIDVNAFINDSTSRRKQINKWIRDNGGIPNTADIQDPDDTKGYNQANRNIHGTTSQPGIVDETLALYIDPTTGEVRPDVHNLAASVGELTHEFIVRKVKEAVGGQFTANPETPDVKAPYFVTAEAIAEESRWHKQTEDNAGLSLTNFLRNQRNEQGTTLWIDENGDFNVNGRPVVKGDVSPSTWYNWMDYLKKNGRDEAVSYIHAQILDAVAAKKKAEEKEFVRADAETLAKDFMERNGVKWTDIDLGTQQDIITAVEGFHRRHDGFDIDSTVVDERRLDVQRHGMPGFVPLSPEQAFGQELLRFVSEAEEVSAEASAAAAAKTSETQTFEGALKNIDAYIQRIAQDTGILNSGVSREYGDYFLDTIIPRIEANLRFTDFEDIETLRTTIMQQFENLPAFERSSADYDRQTGRFPPGFLGGPEFVTGTPEPVEEDQFDVSVFDPKLQELAFERPEFAEFLQGQILSGEFREEFEAASRQHDAMTAEYQRGASGSARQSAEKNLSDARANLSGAKQAYDARAAGDQTVSVARADVQKYQDRVDTAERELENTMERFQKDFPGRIIIPGKTYTGEFKVGEYGLEREFTRDDRRTIAGQETEIPIPGEKEPRRSRLGLPSAASTPQVAGLTEEAFLAQRLPGFETQFKASPFFRKKELRLEREQQIEDARLEQERLKADDERRKLLTAGTGRGAGTGLTVFRTRT